MAMRKNPNRYRNIALIAEESWVMKLDAKYLAEIKARCNAATPGPWHRHDTRDYAEIHTAEGEEQGFSPVALADADYNADFIAYAIEDIPALLAEVERLTDQHQFDVHNLAAMQATLNQQAKNCENLLTAKDQQIATLTVERDDARRQLDMYGGDEGITAALQERDTLKKALEGVFRFYKVPEKRIAKEIEAVLQVVQKREGHNHA